MIHQTAILSNETQLGKNVTIGPYTIIRGTVRIGDNTVIENSVTIGTDYGVVELGTANHIYAGAIVGGSPQDKKYKNEKTFLKIGNQNHLREYSTISLGTVTGGGTTRVGDGNLIMAYAHLGHDCVVGDNNVIANNCQFAGHVTVQNNIIVGGSCAINQFVKIGSYSFIGGFSAINKDIIPYCIAQGNYAMARATNKIGLERAGFTDDQIDKINRTIRILTKSTDSMETKIDRIIKECGRGGEIDTMIEFIKSSQRGLAL